jgi:hypothetical protein
MKLFCHSIGAIAFASLLPLQAQAASGDCARLLQRLGGNLADATCFESGDLTTNNVATTPANNSIVGLPAFAFTPITDRSVISPSESKRAPITKAVPGLQLQARIAGDPTGQARFLLRLPNDWNGKLVVAGASGTRSEFNGDFAWSDFVLQQGYAYASQNKGVLNLQLSTAADPLACRLNPSPASGVYVNFYDNGPGQEFSRWQEYIIKAGELARIGVGARYGKPPRHTYAVGTSNGGYQVRRAVELAPGLFDGGVDWEGTYVDERDPNLLTDLPPAILNYPDYVASGFDANSTAAKNIRGAGYPPDITGAGRLAVDPELQFVLGSHPVPVAEAARPHVRHVRQRYGHLQLRCPPGRLGCRRQHGELRNDWTHPASAGDRRRHHGRTAADRSPCARLRAQGARRRPQSERATEGAVPALRSAERYPHRDLQRPLPADRADRASRARGISRVGGACGRQRAVAAGPVHTARWCDRTATDRRPDTAPACWRRN